MPILRKHEYDLERLPKAESGESTPAAVQDLQTKVHDQSQGGGMTAALIAVDGPPRDWGSYAAIAELRRISDLHAFLGASEERIKRLRLSLPDDSEDVLQEQAFFQAARKELCKHELKMAFNEFGLV